MTIHNATTADVAEALNVKPATVRRYAIQGRIPCVTTPGGHRRYDLAEVVQAAATNSRAVSMQSTPPDADLETDVYAEVVNVPFTPARRRLVQTVTFATERPVQRRPMPIYDSSEDLELAATDMTVA